jgi:lipopolysaccharide assembly protein A
MRALNWLWRGFLFIVLFAFALKNQQPVDLHWFFGYQWQAPMIFIVLAVFVAGCISGVLAMLPSWWRHRRQARMRMTESPASKGKTSKSPAQVEAPSTLPSQLPYPPDVAAPRKQAP